MHKIRHTLTSFIGRTLIYISVFILGAALHELCLQLMRPTLQSNGALSLTILTLAAFVVTGALLAREGRVLSRIASASTLLVLGLIALRIGHASVPDPYLLVLALGIATIGAQPSLHRKAATMRQAALYSILTVFVALAVSVVFAYVMLVLDRISQQ